MKYVCLGAIIFIYSIINSFAQSGVRDSAIRFPLISISYGVFSQKGDLEERFGNASILGFEALYKSKKSWIYGFSGGAIFGNEVNDDDLLSTISTEHGQIIGMDGLYADVRIFERGYHISTTFGRIFSFKKPNPNSGIMVTVGPGFIQHKIRIETIGNTVPQLDDEYKKGYDHLTNGLELRETIGYAYFSNRQLVNFFLGFEFIQGFTSNRRDFNFDNPENDESNRVDLMYGVKLGWVLPLYKKKPAAYYLY